MRKRAIGLEFTDRAINFLDLTHTSGQYIINQWEVVSLPSGVIVDGEVNDLGGLSQLIKPLLGRKSMFNPIPVMVGISGLEACVRKIRIPSVPIREMDEIIAWEGENILPYPIHEVYYGYQIIERSAEDMQILFAALPKVTVEDYLQLFRELHLPVQLLTVQALGLVNFANHAGELVGYTGVLARVRFESVDFVLFYEGRLEIVRTIAVSASHIGGIDFFIVELLSTLEHFQTLTGIWLNTGFFFGDKRFLQAVRSEMPSFHWRHLQLSENVQSSEPLSSMAAEELTCAMGLCFAGVM